MREERPVTTISYRVYIWILILYSNILVFSVDISNYSLIFAGENFYHVLLGALESPPRLLTPIFDGYFLLTRLFTGLAAQISKENIAGVSLVFGAIFHAYCGTYILRNEYSWLIDKFVVRLLLSIFITFGPGMTEIIGSPVCVAYSASFLLILLLLKRKVLDSRFDQIQFGICAFSTNFLLILIPLLVVRWLGARSKIYLYIFIFIILYTFLSFSQLREARMPFMRVDIEHLSKIDLFFFLKERFLDSLYRILSIGYKHNVLLAISVFISALLSILCLIEGRKIPFLHTEIALGLLLCGFLFYFLHSFGRNYQIVNLDGRHGMMAVTPIVLGLTILLTCNLKILFASTNLSTLIVCLLLILNYRSLFVNNFDKYHVEQVDWSDFLDCITRDNKSVTTCELNSYKSNNAALVNKQLMCNNLPRFNICSGMDQFGLRILYRILRKKA